MNPRFPEVFGFLLLLVLACSFALPSSTSGRIANTFQFVFAPVAGPIQWMIAAKPDVRPDVPILRDTNGELARLREEKAALQAYAETLFGQVETLRHRQAEAERVGERLRDLATLVKVLGVDGSSRDVLRLAGTTAATIEPGQPVIAGNGLVGRVRHVGLGNQSSVRLVTDKGNKLVGRFARYEGVALVALAIDPPIVEGVGDGMMKIDSLRMVDVRRAGLRVGDFVLLSDTSTADWPIEVHGYRVGAISYVAERADAPLVADVRVRPEVDLMTLREAWVVGRKAE